MLKPILTICIASYNKADLTLSLVNTILSNRNEKLGVVVVDNSSTDDTVEKLQTIQDPRFELVINSHNIGGSANMVHAIYSGGGVLPIL